MSEQMHTPEPWVFDDYANVKAAGEYVRVSGFALSGGSIPIANSRRIVACVNACKGYTTEELEKHPAPIVTNLLNARDTAEQQRDKLLEACKRARANMPDGPCYQQLHTVIAEIEASK